MPRPDKQINSRGPLDGPVSPARPVVWKKRTGPETVEVSDDSGAIDITVDDITVTTQRTAPPEEISKWTARATSAQLPIGNELADDVVGSETQREPQPTRTEWVVTRTIEGRSYRRTDILTTLQEHTGA